MTYHNGKLLSNEPKYHAKRRTTFSELNGKDCCTLSGAVNPACFLLKRHGFDASRLRQSGQVGGRIQSVLD